MLAHTPHADAITPPPWWCRRHTSFAIWYAELIFTRHATPPWYAADAAITLIRYARVSPLLILRRHCWLRHWYYAFAAMTPFRCHAACHDISPPLRRCHCRFIFIISPAMPILLRCHYCCQRYALLVSLLRRSAIFFIFFCFSPHFWLFRRAFHGAVALMRHWLSPSYHADVHFRHFHANWYFHWLFAATIATWCLLRWFVISWRCAPPSAPHVDSYALPISFQKMSPPVLRITYRRFDVALFSAACRDAAAMPLRMPLSSSRLAIICRWCCRAIDMAMLFGVFFFRHADARSRCHAAPLLMLRCHVLSMLLLFWSFSDVATPMPPCFFSSAVVFSTFDAATIPITACFDYAFAEMPLLSRRHYAAAEECWRFSCRISASFFRRFSLCIFFLHY